ncbi:MAG: helix-turn-helix transcriptional regulator [Scytonematopsis contorta HA4267-MV1]|nr:helix-turn-helix transcriptional regulator [Scytonematopsis contorta HA4267-MV1]
MSRIIENKAESISRPWKVDKIPRLMQEKLNGICRALNCQPGELLVCEPDDSDGKVVAIVDVV